MNDASRSSLNFQPMQLLHFAIIYIRLYLGGWMLLNGLNHFVEIFPQPMGGTMASSQLLVTLIETGMFGLVKVIEIIVGIMLLLDCFTPLALVLAMPISTIVWYNHAILGGRLIHLSMGNGCLLFNILLLLAYLRYFLPMMKLRSTMGSIADFKRLPEIFVSQANIVRAPESQHRIKIVIAGLAVTAMLAYQLHPVDEQLAGAGKTPAVVVAEYMNLAFKQGKRSEAEKLYFSAEAIKDEGKFAVPKEGVPLNDQIVNVVAQGPNVAVHHRFSDPQNGARLEAVELYRVSRNQIAGHTTVVQPVVP